MKPASQVKKLRGDYTANGHHFSDKMKCQRCRISFTQHQQDPRPCPAVMKAVEEKLATMKAHLSRLRAKHTEYEVVVKSKGKELAAVESLHKGAMEVFKELEELRDA